MVIGKIILMGETGNDLVLNNFYYILNLKQREIIISMRIYLNEVIRKYWDGSFNLKNN